MVELEGADETNHMKNGYEVIILEVFERKFGCTRARTNMLYAYRFTIPKLANIRDGS